MLTMSTILGLCGFIVHVSYTASPNRNARNVRVLSWGGMKCPHCKVGIAEQFKSSQIANYPQTILKDNLVVPPVTWVAQYQRCPECHEVLIMLDVSGPGGMSRFWGYPSAANAARDIPAQVTAPYRDDFREACLVLPISAKASAALSRRCLQAVLRDKAGTKKKDLFDQIEEVSAPGILPSHIVEDLHAVRNIGNFAAHPMKSTNTGEIIEVEPGEAEWNLDVLESLFDFYFVQPALSAKRKAELNKKLKEAGKPEIK